MNREQKTIVKGVLMVLGLAVLCAVVWVRSSRIGPSRSGLGKSFEFDFEKYLDVDPSLIKYRETEPINPGLDEVTALAVAEGRILVAGPGSVVVMDSAGKELSVVPVKGTPLSLAVDGDSNFFVGAGNHIEVFDSSGKRTAVWEAPFTNALIVNIVFRGDDVLAGEGRKGQVLRYDRDGVLLDSITGLTLFSSPSFGMVVDAEQKLWVSNPGARELRRYGKDGALEASWDRPGREIENFCGCCNPVDIAIRADGNIVTSEKDMVRVKVVSTSGDLVSVVAGPREFDSSIQNLDIEVDSRGRVLALDPVKKVIRVFEPKKEE